MPRPAERIANHLNIGRHRLDSCNSRKMYLYRAQSYNSFRHSLLPREASECKFVQKSPTIISIDDENPTDDDEHILFTIIENANLDGVRHLQASDKCTKYCWAAIIVIFICLACFQIWIQINMYITTPIATNVEVDYPSRIRFPAVAICNNNEFRLTYLTGPAIQNRKLKLTQNISSNMQMDDNKTLFDKVIENAWDVDAIKFLRNAAHWKSRMILGCTWPNGTNCRLSDFKAVWTMTGLCWAINTDPIHPHYITASGPVSGLKLLMNIERYERVESCTPYLRTKNLPGLKILIYNQTDFPGSSLDGVNVPPGYTMNIPFRMQIRHKLWGCIQETDQQKSGLLPFDDPSNVNTCILRKFYHEIEQYCNCSMHKVFSSNPKNVGYQNCNVKQYFKCVLPHVQFAIENNFDRFNCETSCDKIDYTAWQDMNLLPNNIFPYLIESSEEEDIDDVVDDFDTENNANFNEFNRDEHFQCQENQLLTDEQVRKIKRQAQLAYEKQSRYQDDIRLRTKRLILKLREATQKLIDLGWGWTESTYKDAYDRLNSSVKCYREMSTQHAEIFATIQNPPLLSEETKVEKIYELITGVVDGNMSKSFETTIQLREEFGERYDQMLKNIQKISSTVNKLWKIYDRSSFKSALGVDLRRMNLVLNLTEQYEAGRLQRRAWAEKMQSRNMHHFFEQDFYEGWYNPILKDLDENLVRKLHNLDENLIPELRDLIENASGLLICSFHFFGDTSPAHLNEFNAFINNIISCTLNDVKNESITMLSTFKKVMHEFQSAYTNLCKKELPAYLANFDFGSEFVNQNFAMVNVFLGRMNIETWRQESTYSIWSLACDVGGALGLFLGASLLTIIDLIYLCFQYGVCDSLWLQYLMFWKLKKTHPFDKMSVEVLQSSKAVSQDYNLESMDDKSSKITRPIPTIVAEDVDASQQFVNANLKKQYPDSDTQKDKCDDDFSIDNEQTFESLPSKLGTLEEPFSSTSSSLNSAKLNSNQTSPYDSNLYSRYCESESEFQPFPSIQDLENSKNDNYFTLFRPKYERQTFI